MTIEAIIDFRKELHQHPEVSGNEKETKRRVRQFVQQFHPDDTIEVGRYGLIFVFKGKQKGKSILVRSELDALPIQEINDFDHRSVFDGVSHKCGHDGHMAILAALAYRLSQRPLERGTCYLLYQPAEETGEGAREVYHSDAFQQLKLDAVIALHNLPGFPKKSVVVKEGAFTPAVRSCIVKFHGKTSHAAEPENGKNPAEGMADFLKEALSYTQSDQNQKDFFLVTPICMTLGECSYGISAGYGEVHLTIRASYDSVLSKQSEALKLLAQKIAEGYGLRAEVAWVQSFSANINDKSLVDGVRRAAQTLGLQTIELPQAMKWGEDFGLFTESLPGTMFGIGAGIEMPALHNPDYDFPDELIETGSAMFEQIVKQFLEEGNLS